MDQGRADSARSDAARVDGWRLARRGSAQRTGVLGVAIVLAGALVLAACSKSGDGGSGDASTDKPALSAQSSGLVDEPAPSEGGSLTVGVPGETDTYNPAFGQWAESGNLVSSTFYEPLFVYDRDYELVPWLAESMEHNDDFTEWKITVRPGITMHDGAEVTGEIVALNQRVAWQEGLAKIAYGHLIADIQATGPYEMTVTTTRPWAAYPTILAGQGGNVAGRSQFETDDPKTAPPVGTAAFEFVDWVRDAKLTVKRYDDYWGGPCSLENPGELVTKMCESVGVPKGQRNGPFVDEIEFMILVDGQSRAAALAARDVDMVLTQEIADLAALRGQYDIVADYDSQKTFIQINHSKAPFDNEHARKALAYGTDYQGIIDLVAEGEPIVRDTSPFSASSPWGVPNDQTGYPATDLGKAAEELAAYKADTGQDLTFTLSGIASTEELTIMQALQTQWAEIGIEAEVSSLEQVAQINSLVGGTFQAALTKNYAYPDPDSSNYFFSKRSAEGPIFINFAQYATDETEADLDAGMSTTDRAERKAAYTDLAERRNEAVTEIWLYDTPYALVTDQRVHGLNWFRVLPWGNFLPKPYVTSVWLEER